MPGTQGPYPQGPCKVITTWPQGNPAAGVNFSLAVPPGKIWVFLSCGFSLVTNATAALRTVELVASTSINSPYVDSFCIETQTINLTWFYRGMNFGQSQPPVNAAVNVTHYIQLPGKIVMTAGDLFQIDVINIQAGDQITVTSGGCDIEEYLLS
jgi:hypothetical protein